MKAVVFDKPGEPGAVLALRDVPRPEPGLREALIQVEASRLTPSDVMFIQGTYRNQPVFPQTAGMEAVGTIVALGSSVDSALGLRTGLRVVFRHPGAWAEAAAAPQERVFALPDGVSWTQASGIFLNPVTAWGLLEASGADRGDWVLANAGASSVGRWLTAFGHERGMRLIAITRSAASARQARDAGADEAFAETDIDALRIVTLSGGGTAASFDAVGGRQGGLALESLRRGGLLLVYGRMSGEPYPLHNSLILYRDLSIRGFGVNDLLARTPRQEIQGVMEESARLLRSLPALTAREEHFPLEELRAALGSSAAERILVMRRDYPEPRAFPARAARLNWDGVVAVCALKIALNVALELKPASWAIARSVRLSLSGRSMRLFTSSTRYELMKS